MSIPRRTFRSPSEPVTSVDLPDAVETGGELRCGVAVSAPLDGPEEAHRDSAETVPVESAPAAPTPLSKARSELAATDAELAALLSARAEALAADNDARAMELDGEIAAKEKLRKVRLDRVNLRQAEVSQAAAREREARHEAKILAAEALVAERTRLAGRLANQVAVADRTFVKLLAVNRALATAWAWQPTIHGGAILLGDSAMLAALKNEIYRTGARPSALGGLPDHPLGPSFPGRQPPMASMGSNARALCRADG